VNLSIPLYKISFDLEECLAHKVERGMGFLVPIKEQPDSQILFNRAIMHYLSNGWKRDEFRMYWSERPRYLTKAVRDQLDRNGWSFFHMYPGIGAVVCPSVESGHAMPMFDLVVVASIIENVGNSVDRLRSILKDNGYNPLDSAHVRQYIRLVEQAVHDTINHMTAIGYMHLRGNHTFRIALINQCVKLWNMAGPVPYELYFDLKDFGFVVRCVKPLRDALNRNFGPFVTDYIGDC